LIYAHLSQNPNHELLLFVAKVSARVNPKRVRLLAGNAKSASDKVGLTAQETT
jgi:hypothetical protein